MQLFMKKPLTLSLVIPVYNEAVHIKVCLDAIAAQTQMPDEVIVVDNNSTDATRKIAAAYPFVRVITEKKQGVLYARNTGFDAARSEIIGRIDADTLLPPDWVEHVRQFYEVAEHKNHALTGGGYFYNVRSPRVNGWLLGQMAYRLNRLIMGHYILWGSNMALPKELWLAVRKDTCPRQDIHEDLDIAIHLHRLGYPITYRETLRVGVKMRRVYTDRHALWQNLLWWPRTLRVHGHQAWFLGLLGSVVLYAGSPLVRAADYFPKRTHPHKK